MRADRPEWNRTARDAVRFLVELAVLAGFFLVVGGAFLIVIPALSG